MKADERGDAYGFLKNGCAEEPLIKEAVAGDRNAFEELMLPYMKILYNFILFRTSDKDACGDIVQETMLSVWQDIKSFSFRSSVKTWILGIASNKISDHYRKTYRVQTEDIDEYQEIQDVRTPVDDMIVHNDIRSAVSKLKNEEKLLIYLIFYAQLSYSEASEIMHIPTGTVKSRMSAIKNKLKSELGEEYYNGMQ